MGVRKRKPTSAGRRFQSSSDFKEITKARPERSLTEPLPSSGGRNSYGRKTSRHRGGGHKRRYRIVDFWRDKDGIPARVAAIEYDPNRNARIALLHYADGEKRYIIAPEGVGVGDVLQSGHGAEIRSGNALQLRYIPVGSTIHNVELRPGGGGKLARRRVERAAGGKRRRLRDLEASLDGDASRPDRLPGDDRCRRQLGGRAVVRWQGGTESLAWRAPADARRRHEPRRPPARWWRGQVVRWAPPGLAVGPTRRAHSPQAQAVRPSDRPSPPRPRRPSLIV